MKRKIKVRKLSIDIKDGIDAIALVDEPAIEKDFMLFDKQEKFKFSIDQDKQIITGPAMTADKLIYRNDGPEGDEEYYVYFSAEDIKKMSELFLKQSKVDNFNFDHNSSELVSSGYLVESWIVEDPMNDKSYALGFTKINKNDWFVSMKIEDTEVWEKVKNGEYNGFSIEGMFLSKYSKANFATKTTYKKWVTNASDVGPCDFCKGLEGKEVPWGENWSHEGYDDLVPGKVHKGCKCTWDSVIKWEASKTIEQELEDIINEYEKK